MPYDEKLAERIRRVLGGRARVSEKEMFGGIAWLLDGKMFVGIVKDELMARVGADAHDEAIRRPHARTMDFTGRPMRGYVFVKPAGLKTDGALKVWVEQSAAHAAALPAKKPKTRRVAKAVRKPGAKRRK